MDNPTIPCELCGRNVPFNDYIGHVELCRHRNSVLNLLNPMFNTFLESNNVMDDSMAHIASIEDFVDEYQMNSIIAAMIGNVHHGVNDIDDAITEVDKSDIEKDSKCSICLENFEHIESIVKTKCNHLFCNQCIMKWFQENNKCPLCLFNFNDK
jgi:hypothetical protein